VQRLGSYEAPFDLTEPPRRLLAALGTDPGEPAVALARVRGVEPRLAAMVEPMLGLTFAPTRISASEKINVIPARAEVQVDCRVPPGMQGEAVRARVREALPEDGYEIGILEEITGNASPVETPLMAAIRDWVQEEEPDAEAVPTMLPAFTDSRHFRAAFPECVAYGFFPQRHQTLFETWPLIHAADERINVRDLGVAARFFADLPRRLLG
jgi:acetylornithine deacetylase/succinyl-diaminopimelate desuccinylase-like protein